MSASGLDIGGSKIETQIFDRDWTMVARQRVTTPSNYSDLVKAIADQIAWADAKAGGLKAVGIGAAGLVHPDSGLALTANLPASGKPFPHDIARAANRPVTYINDCRALALSEAVFGAGQGHRTVMALIIGTGIGGGIAVDRALMAGPTATGGEFGHIAAPAHLVAAHDLPLVPCGCGRTGCIETFVAGPGLARLAQHMTGQNLTPPEIAALRHDDMAKVWTVWCTFVAELIHTLTLTVDPDMIVLGGGLSAVSGVTDDLTHAAAQTQIADFATPPLVLAHGGDASGARGAAFAAWTQVQDG